MTTTAPALTHTEPGWRLRLESLPVERLRGLVIATGLVVAGAVVLAVNLTGAPGRTGGEGTVVGRAWAVEHLNRLSPTPYLYDQPPLGWVQVGAWVRLAGTFGRAPTAVAAGREAMVVAFVAGAALLWLLARRLGLARWSAAVALVAFGLSPLAIALHRQASLENVAVPWMLAAFVLAASPQRRPVALAGSGALLGVAVLSSPSVLLVLPALALSWWQVTTDENRRQVLAVAGAAFVATCGTFVVYALLKGQLTGDGATLTRGVADQLTDLARTGSVLSGGTPGHEIVAGWLGLDPVLPVLGLLSAVLALVALPRLAPVAGAFLVVAAAIVRPGHLTPSLAVLLLPFAALLVGGAAERLWPGSDPATARGRRRAAPALAADGTDPYDDPAARATGPGPVPAKVKARRRERPRTRAGLPAAVGLSALAVVVVAAVWAPEAGSLLSDHDEAVPREAARWVAANVDQGPVLVDAGLGADLAVAGFPADRLVIHPTIDDPPTARQLALDGWTGDGAIVSSPATRAAAGADHRLADLLDGSLVVATFGSGDGRVEVRAVDPGATDVISLRRHDPAAAQAQGDALSRDARLTFTPGARRLLVDGNVDERVMTALAALADQGTVEVDGFPADRAEVAAGEARRSVVLRTDTIGGTDDIVRLLDRQQAPYEPADVTLGDGGRIRVSWAIAALS